MPVVTERSLESGTVGDALTNAWRATLPASLAENYLVGWVLSYGEQRPETDPMPTRDWLRHSDRRGGIKWLAIVQLCRNLLSERLPLYIEALFSFGRPMRATELALQDCVMAIESGALSSISSQISQRLKIMSPSNEEGRLRKLASEAIELHRRTLRRYEQISETWEHEVSDLHGLIERVQMRFQPYRDDEDLAFLVEKIIDLQSRTSALPGYLASAGLSLRRMPDSHDKQTSDFLATVLPSIGLLLLATHNGRDSHLEFVIHHALDRIADAEFERAIAPRIKAEEDSLGAVYQGGDPFAPYDLGKSPPTLELLMLVQENQLLHDRQSTWLSRWKSRLLHPGWQFTPPDFSDRLTDESIRWAALRADSMIKEKVLGEHLGSAPSMVALLQKAFEKEWVQSLVRSLIENPGEGGRLREGWTLDEISKYISLVVQSMNSHGYALNLPRIDRLATLLEKALRGDYASIIRDDGW